MKNRVIISVLVVVMLIGIGALVLIGNTGVQKWQRTVNAIDGVDSVTMDHDPPNIIKSWDDYYATLVIEPGLTKQSAQEIAEAGCREGTDEIRELVLAAAADNYVPAISSLGIESPCIDPQVLIQFSALAEVVDNPGWEFDGNMRFRVSDSCEGTTTTRSKDCEFTLDVNATSDAEVVDVVERLWPVMRGSAFELQLMNRTSESLTFDNEYPVRIKLAPDENPRELPQLIELARTIEDAEIAYEAGSLVVTTRDSKEIDGETARRLQEEGATAGIPVEVGPPQ